jgi:2-oxoacid:acceptor oxidoreductase gamma subunit (pyruvate/2-ketoisovalerate family)/2-oxoacid:acceptor oxidoreductase delta subunit (pyruvate/2-ketoisovalerate family)
MQEMLLVGRGGEGVVAASQILADTFARAGYWVQSFPEFKAERRGAPISAFLRWDESEPVHRRYKLRECDALVSVTPAPPSPELLARVRPGGLVVLNLEDRLPAGGDYRIARVPASRIARRHGVLSAEGRPMGNIALLGACVRLLLPDGLELLEQAVAARFGKLGEANVAAARDGYRAVQRQRRLDGDHATPIEIETAAAPAADWLRFPISRTTSLAADTGSWSLERPVILDPCTACGVCALFCPEGAMERAGGTMEIDYFHCKGCGICEVVCPVRGAIALEEVAV